jgi:hypothetical protein
MYLVDRLKQYISKGLKYFRKHPLVKPIVVSTFFVGVLFLLFVWVPYKQNERNLITIEKQVTEARNVILEARQLIRILEQPPTNFEQNAVSSRLYLSTNSADRLSELTAVMPKSLSNAQKTVNTEFHALIFYPAFVNNIKQRVTNIKIPFEEKHINEFLAWAKLQFLINQTLLNVSNFKIDTYFDKPLAEYGTKERTKKLSALREAIGKSEYELSQFDSTDDKRVAKTLEILGAQRVYIDEMIAAAASGNFASAERSKAKLADSLNYYKRSLASNNAWLLVNPLAPKLIATIDTWLVKYDKILESIDEIQEKHY